MHPAQLNCACDMEAKHCILVLSPQDLIHNPIFPQGPVMLMVDSGKVTLDSWLHIQFMAHQQGVQQLFSQQKILSNTQFHEVAWEWVCLTVHSIPKMFQMFGSKQVFEVSAVLANLSKQKEYSHLTNNCPICTATIEFTSHIMYCLEEGRRYNLQRQADCILQWLILTHTIPALILLIIIYIQHRGLQSMTKISATIPAFCYDNMAVSQDTIGWCFMEGTISKKISNFTHLIFSSSRPPWMCLHGHRL